jgi:hypothetical protein
MYRSRSGVGKTVMECDRRYNGMHVKFSLRENISLQPTGLIITQSHFHVLYNYNITVIVITITRYL